MGEDCKDCVHVNSLKEDVTDLKEDIKDIYSRLVVVEKFSASGGEQIKMIFNILNEIKDSIKGISSKIETIQTQPSKEYSKIKMTVITSICSGIIGVILGLIFTRK